MTTIPYVHRHPVIIFQTDYSPEGDPNIYPHIHTHDHLVLRVKVFKTLKNYPILNPKKQLGYSMEAKKKVARLSSTAV